MSDTGTSKYRRPGLATFVVVAFTGWINSGYVAPPIAAEQSVPAFRTITSEQLVQMLQEKDFTFVNVHIPYEGEIAQTDAFIPFDQIGINLDRLPTDKGASIVLYCKSGRMSGIAANELAALGYTDVSHLAGGMIEWERAGQAVLRR
ncbi:MAG: rhodanese-like domain-containing protein [Devosia sp.]